MCSARQSGHTTAMCKVAYEYFDKVAFLCPNCDIARMVSSNCFSKVIKEYSKGDIIKHNSLETITKDGYYMFGSYKNLNTFRGREFEAVFVDPSCLLKPKEEKEIYAIMAPCMLNYPQKFFVFIQ